jgi:hypothetical protein
MNETTFENARIGDKVWDFNYGWGVIAFKSASTIDVNFRSLTLTYSLAGWERGKRRTLFWDEIKFTAPPRPKRMVKKEVVVWYSISKEGAKHQYETEAGMLSHVSRHHGYYPLKLTGTYEVEE